MASLAALLRQHQERILGAWEQAASEMPPARNLPRTSLRDHLPKVLNHVVERLERLAAGWPLTPAVSPVPAGADQHAVARLREGYDVGEVVSEYALLRAVLFDQLTQAEMLTGEGVALLNRALDAALTEAVEHFQRARERLMTAMDRVSTETVGSFSLDQLLESLMRIMMETSPAVDSVAILLREGERLRVRSAIGLIKEREAGFSLAIGEGFSGTVSRTREPVTLRDAAHDPLVASQFIRDLGLRALYGVPLVDGDLIGVAHIGSLTSYQFSDEDRLLFRAVANRATAFIVQAQLRDAERAAHAEAERTAALLREDIAERQRVEEQLREEVQDRERIMGILGHDLRNPLNGISITTRLLLERTAAQPELQRGLKLVERSASRMARMIHDLLDFTRSRHGGIPVVAEPLDLHELAREVRAELEPSDPGRRIRVEASGDVRCRADRDRIGQVMSNLVSNGLQHGDPDAPLVVRLTGGEKAVELQVENRGPAVAPERRAEIFEPFVQRGGDGSEGRRAGLGLGLYIVHQIVRAHGGSISLDSRDGAVIFTVTLPRG
jgi:signal transduction histidine kinase